MDMQQILHDLNKSSELFTLPQIFSEILKLISSEESSVKDIAGVIIKDPTLTSRVLKMANSSFYRREGEISTVNQAVMMLGANAIKSLVLSASILNLSNINRDRKDHFRDPRLFWKHSLETGIGAQLLARTISYSVPEEGIVAGLLHDIGILFLETRYPSQYEMVVKLNDSGESITAAEKKIFGITHPEVGVLMGRRWELPAKFVDVIEHHHLVGDETGPEGINSLVYITALADNLSRNNPESNAMGLEAMINRVGKLCSVLGISRGDLDTVRIKMIEETIASASTFDVDIGDPAELLSQANEELCKIYLMVENLFRERQELSRKLLEEERQSGTIESLHIAVSTLAHYINNATMAISGHSQILAMLLNGGKIHDEGGKLPKALEVIDTAVLKIGVTLNVLKEITSLKNAKYFNHSNALDIEAVIKERLNELLPQSKPAVEKV